MRPNHLFVAQANAVSVNIIIYTQYIYILSRTLWLNRSSLRSLNGSSLQEASAQTLTGWAGCWWGGNMSSTWRTHTIDNNGITRELPDIVTVEMQEEKNLIFKHEGATTMTTGFLSMYFYIRLFCFVLVCKRKDAIEPTAVWPTEPAVHYVQQYRVDKTERSHGPRLDFPIRSYSRKNVVILHWSSVYPLRTEGRVAR